jgi:hypothetical protein
LPAEPLPDALVALLRQLDAAGGRQVVDPGVPTD